MLQPLPMQVFILLFNARTDNEGIHTLKLTDPEVGERNIVLMFESEDDATRYSLMLEAQDFPVPTVEAIAAEEVEGFCQDAGYECTLVPEGTLVVPPETAADELDWQADGKPSQASDDDASEFSATELERIRKRLEGLL